jgi:hypothetical protein
MTETFGRNVCNRKPKIPYVRQKAERFFASNSNSKKQNSGARPHGEKKSTTDKIKTKTEWGRPTMNLPTEVKLEWSCRTLALFLSIPFTAIDSTTCSIWNTSSPENKRKNLNPKLLYNQTM